MKLLHVDASITGNNSISRKITAAIVDRLRQTTPGLQIIYRDVGAAPLPHLSLENLPFDHHLVPGLKDLPSTPEAKQHMGASQQALDEFLAADIVVIGAPMYNFTIPTQLKAWLDRILVSGKTFKYSSEGVQGLAGGKRVIVAISRGGMYGADSPAAAAEHAETYLRAVFGFIGIANPDIIVAEGVQMGPDLQAKAVEEALQTANAL